MILIIDREGKLLRVQVKTTKFKIRDGVYQVSLKTCGGNRSGQTIKNFKGSTALMVKGHRSVKPAHKKLNKFDSYYSHLLMET